MKQNPLKHPYPGHWNEFLIDEFQFLTLLDPLRISGTSFDLMKGVTLRIATNVHKRLVKKYYDENSWFHGPYTGYKVTEDTIASEPGYKISKNEILPSVGAGIVPINPEEFAKRSVRVAGCEWDFWVVDIDRDTLTNKEYELFLDALLLSEANVSTGITFSEFSVRKFVDPQRFYQDYPIVLVFDKNGNAHVKDYRRTLSKEHIDSVVDMFNALKMFDFKKYPLIGNAIAEYKNILLLPKDSSLAIVGLFSILELLVTHDSRNSDAPGITWQLSKKIPLLNHRMKLSLDFARHFHCDKDVKEETVIERLYMKRSVVAHGNQNIENLQQKLQVISKGDEISFLKLLIRRIITYALNDPDLLIDLKEC